MLNESDAHRFAMTWIAAWNAHDIDAILAHYADHVVLVSPVAAQRLQREDGTVRGRTALREYFATGLRQVPDLHFSLQHVLTGLDGLALIYERENGALVVEAIVLDPVRTAAEVRVYYIGLPNPPSD